jgi:hypothetical protein
MMGVDVVSKNPFYKNLYPFPFLPIYPFRLYNMM